MLRALLLLPERGNDDWGSGEIGYCYTDDLHYRYVQITDDDERMHRLLYVDPAPGMQRGDIVYAGSIVGYAQNIAARYDEKTKHMKNHVHYEIRVPDGDSYVCVDPREC
jgi:hypothetical protein